MTRVLIADDDTARTFIEQRRASGHDLYDEMWDGVYRAVPAGTGLHGFVQAMVTTSLTLRARQLQLACTGPVNIGRELSYRVPDAAIMATVPIHGGTFFPTALLLVEVRTKPDSTYEKFGFYRDHDVQEIVVALPDEQRIELWARDARPGHTFRLVEDSAVLQQTGCPSWLASELGW